jgi:ATP-binding cassette subfamily B (MDR/TAP) protein 1
MIGTALIVALTQSWKLTLIIVAAVFPLFVILSFALTREANVDAKVLQVYSKAANLAEEILGSIKTVRAFEANATLLKKYNEWLAKAMVVGNQKSWIWATIFGSDFFFGYMPYALAFWYVITPLISMNRSSHNKDI